MPLPEVGLGREFMVFTEAIVVSIDEEEVEEEDATLLIRLGKGKYRRVVGWLLLQLLHTPPNHLNSIAHHQHHHFDKNRMNH